METSNHRVDMLGLMTILRFGNCTDRQKQEYRSAMWSTYKNWGRSVAGLLAVLVLLLGFTPTTFAASASHADAEEHISVTDGNPSHLPADEHGGADHQHSGSNTCHGSTCSYVGPQIGFSGPVVFEQHNYNSGIADLTTDVMLTSLYRPPRT